MIVYVPQVIDKYGIPRDIFGCMGYADKRKAEIVARNSAASHEDQKWCVREFKIDIGSLDD